MQQQENAGTAAPAYFSAGDMIFVVAAIIVAVLVARLGYVTYQDGYATEMVKANGENFAKWLTEQGAARDSDKSFAPCTGAEATWASCREALVAQGGPMSHLKNEFDKANQVFAYTCDRHQTNTHGAILLELGTPKPPDGASLQYAPIEDTTELSKATPLRVSICGRGFSVINIAELTL
ncbi:MAG: hypothetical protein RI928_1124 [Pseudomonadota bacterium]|jgi:hypothetical protein